MQRYAVKQAHDPEEALPLALCKGQRLSYEHRSTRWSGWLWCTTEHGQSASEW